MNFLLSIPSPEISYIDLGIFRIHFYALFILLGIAIAVWFTDRRLTRRGATPGAMIDIAIWAVPFGIIGGRFFHVITHPRDYFYEGADLLATLRIWEGGLAIYGAVIFGAVGVWLGSRQIGLKFWSVADAVAPGVLLAQAIGRLGNYFNTELYGLPTDLPWGLEVPADDPHYPIGLPAGLTFHPTFLYEMIWNLLGVLLILALEKKFRLQWGKVLALYLVVYSAGRVWIESIRIDPSEILLGLRINVWSALIGAAIGIAIFAVQSRRHPGEEPSIWKPGREPNQVSSQTEIESADQ